MTSKPEVQGSWPARMTVGRWSNGRLFALEGTPAEIESAAPLVEVVPREIAERLAQALEETVTLAEVANEDWTGDHSRALNAAIEDLEAYRAVFPKADVATQVVEPG